jgi:zinc transport system substrate-binding protein
LKMRCRNVTDIPWQIPLERSANMDIVLRKIALYVALTGLSLFYMMTVTSCSREKPREPGARLTIVTTLFPLYDFARNIGGDSVEVRLLLPPGVESHSFEPRPEDVVRTSKADMFIFTGRDMEPWAERLYDGVSDKGRVFKVEAGERARYISVDRGQGEGEHQHGDQRGSGRDPHIWLDIDNAKIMVMTIAEAMARKSPVRREIYMANAAAYIKRLDDLDSRFKKGLSSCRSREFIHGGHYAFAYLAARYRLQYLSAYAITADSEPSPKRMAELTQAIKAHDVRCIYYEELLAPRIAETISRETGATLLKLHGIHNLTRQEFEGGATFIGLMEQNLSNLQKGLECR